MLPFKPTVHVDFALLEDGFDSIYSLYREHRHIIRIFAKYTQCSCDIGIDSPVKRCLYIVSVRGVGIERSWHSRAASSSGCCVWRGTSQWEQIGIPIAWKCISCPISAQRHTHGFCLKRCWCSEFLLFLSPFFHHNLSVANKFIWWIAKKRKIELVVCI